jgi:hypothetical protein
MATRRKKMYQLKSERILVPEDIAEISRLFYGKGWTDGLPIVPPTEERVLNLLQGTNRDPHDVIGLIPPSWAEATVEKIAINSVMAGSHPEHLPIIIAAVEAMVERKFNLYAVQATTHPCSPLLLINGPLRNRAGINCGYGAFGPGTLANAVIGRAIRLILINVGGATPGKVDKATHGQPGKYAYAIGENEEESPWEPFHLERGFSREQSTVTVIAAESPHNVNDHSSISAEGILTTIAGTLVGQGNNNFLFQGEPVVIFGPEHAKTIAKDGFVKRDVREWIFQRTKLPKRAFCKEKQEKRFAHLPEDALIPVARKPEDILIVVAGGAGKHSMVIPTFGNSLSVTQSIQS